MKKITGKLSLQWRLTLITALLMTVTCILMYFFISQSAVAGMENLGDYMIRIDNTDSAPITFNMDPSVLFPELSDQLQLPSRLLRNDYFDKILHPLALGGEEIRK